MRNTNISRRGFIGMGGVAAATVGVGALAGCSAQSSTAAGSASVSTGATAVDTPSFLTIPDAISDDEVAETHDYEIVVVGAGNSGIGAVVAALNAGASVCCVEKSVQPNATGMAAGGIDLEASDDAAVEYIVERHLCANDFRSVREVVETWAWRSDEALNAIKDFVSSTDDPMDFPAEGSSIAGTVEFEYPGTDMSATVFVYMPSSVNYASAQPIYAAYAEEQGCDYYYSMPAQQLAVDDDGAVVGVYCLDEDGAYHKFTASKGVILCTGDYQNDEEMVAYYCPDLKYADPMQEGKTGDGIKMGMWIGGQIEPVGHTKMTHNYGAGPMGDQPFLRVKLDGTRFCCESAPLFQAQTFFRLSDEAVEWFQIFDANYSEQVTAWGGEPTDSASFDSYIERGNMWSADTLEELAETCGIEDADTFLATVERYNELAAAGGDEDFGKIAAYMQPIDTAPFYAVHRKLPRTAILSGLLTDGDQHVLDADGNPITGLYAAGNTAGGFFGAVDYPLRVMESDPIGRSTIEGVSVGRAMTGGYVAAQNAANGI